jgi:hypothetical protein
MLYTKDSIRFTAKETATYLAQGIDVSQISTYQQFRQLQKRRARKPRSVKSKQEEQIVVKRYGRRRLNGMMEYSDNYEELMASHRREGAELQAIVFGIIGLIVGGVLAYLLMRQMQVDSRLIRWASVIVGAVITKTVFYAHAPLLWKIIKWTIILTAVAAIGLFVFWLV